MTANVLYKDPASGLIGQLAEVWQTEQAERLEMTRGQAADSLSAKLSVMDDQVYATGAAIDRSAALYNQAVTDPARKKIYEVKKPVSPILIAVAAYLVFLWL